MKNFTARQWVAIVIMEVIILLITGFCIYEFVIGVIDAKEMKTAITGLAWFCLVMGILVFVGLNILMIWFVRKKR